MPGSGRWERGVRLIIEAFACGGKPGIIQCADPVQRYAKFIALAGVAQVHLALQPGRRIAQPFGGEIVARAVFQFGEQLFRVLRREARQRRQFGTDVIMHDVRTE